MCLGIPGEVLAVREEAGLQFGTVRFAAITREVCLECLPQTRVGDWVLVHVGLAISRIDREEAEQTYRALEQLGMTNELVADREQGE